ncbi:inner membrane protein import complex subunit tim54 domain-containing protein [Hirsutella rhossiliensis]|uniref:Mitochondrial import inner membrane translocase subunit TIM54 n=1 Tax=Hirsutella rhossiliensis TaxID=111463 RepID=A0A9P8MLQ2_9HYPO|nr:inner membrane protein import complex subunit tim54 domain-containing protein [Hirsutella rhossiliensis]KAH0957445.1 inner membrane protein import complex subunit tim54 domain-containing protein [Hirsutella rhossiliensis]
MADSNPDPKPASSAASKSPPAAAAAPKPPKPPAAPAGNPALRMLGLPNLPRKLPSRNWLIFWAVTGTLTSAIVYDRREKRRATARWRRAVEPLSRELVAAPNQLPRKLTVYLEAPPGDGLRVAQDHFIEYVKPVLAASGLDWEFVQGRQQGDVRAAVAEKVRRARMADERPGQELPKTDDALVEDLRKKMGVPQYEGVKGDIVIGRHTWKEYIRGLHEGWLGPLDPPPPPPQPEAVVEAEAPTTEASMADAATDKEEGDKEDKKEDKKEEKTSRPPQPPPHNTPDDYSSASLPAHIPAEFSPSAPIPFPHRLGFTQTFVRLGRFFNRRSLADHVGRDVAAVCLAAGREWREAADGQHEQQLALAHEEADWPKRVWKDGDGDGDEQADDAAVAEQPKEKIWTAPVVLDGRIAQRMRRFEMTPEDQARAAAIVVPEDEVEGWVKGSLRGLWRWGARAFESKPRGPNVGNLDDD